MKKNKENHEKYLELQAKRIESALGKETRESRKLRLSQERKTCSLTIRSKKQKRINNYLRKEMLSY